MVGRLKLTELADFALSVSVADQTEVVLTSGESNTTRFAENTIHQNISKESMSIFVRSIIDEGEKGKKIGIAGGTASTKEAITAVVKNSNEIAETQIPDPSFHSLPKPVTAKEVESFSKDVAEITVHDKARWVKKIIDASRDHKMKASGTFETGIGEIIIKNSLGVNAYHPYTEATISTVITASNSSGYAMQTGKSLKDINPDTIARDAIDKAERSKNPTDLPPGKYDVILEEYAVADLLAYLSYMGFGGKHFHEERSFVSGNLGKKIFSDLVTIWEDPYHPEVIPTPFDIEGVPREKIILAEKGVLKNVVYDTYTAGRYKKKSTGHYSGSTAFGPIPSSVVMEAGKSSKEEMIKSIKKGIWVTRFHYVNVQHYTKLHMTGMTKDGTFLIENGKITRPLKNLRFTQSIIEGLSDVEMVGKERMLLEDYGSYLVPALKIKSFNFTSGTEH